MRAAPGSGIGYHALTPTPRATLAELRPAAQLVFGHIDNAGKAIAEAERVREWLPGTLVIVRLWPDDNQSERMTPAEWHARYQPHLRRGLIYLADNEPPLHGGREAIEPRARWYAELIERVCGDGHSLIVGNFAPGTPPDHERDYQALLPMFRALAEHRGRAYWGPHAYYDPQTMEADYFWKFRRPLYFGGRVCRAAGLPLPTTIYTEAGIAVAADGGRGWRLAGISAGEYARQLLQLQARLRDDEGAHVPFCAFCWGPWDVTPSFGLHDAPEFQRALVRALAENPAPQPAPQPIPQTDPQPDPPPEFIAPPRIPDRLADARLAAGPALNIRSGPGRRYPVIGRLPAEQESVRVETHRLPDEEGCYEWDFVEGDGRRGWVARLQERPWRCR